MNWPEARSFSSLVSVQKECITRISHAFHGQYDMNTCGIHDNLEFVFILFVSRKYSARNHILPNFGPELGMIIPNRNGHITLFETDAFHRGSHIYIYMYICICIYIGVYIYYIRIIWKNFWDVT